MSTAVSAAPPAVDADATISEKASEPQQTPFARPLPDCKPPKREPLTETQQSKYDALLAEVKGWTEIKAKEKTGPLKENEKLWLTRECLLRYLRATKWNEKEAAKRLQGTLVWRREYVEDLTADHISPEQETGKQLILGYDKSGRVCHHLSPGRQNTNASPRQIQHLVFMLERVIDMMPAGTETLVLLCNFMPSKNRSNTTPGIGQARETLHILQTHYPERLGLSLIIHVAWFVKMFFKCIGPFMDPNTREKIKFDVDNNQFIPSEQLWTDFGGKCEFEYDHSVYWPALLKQTDELRAERKSRWVAGGQHIGEFEDYLGGILEHGVASPAATETSAAGAEAGEAPAATPQVDELKIAQLQVDEQATEQATEPAPVPTEIETKA